MAFHWDSDYYQVLKIHFWQNGIFVQINTLKHKLKDVEVITNDCNLSSWLCSAKKQLIKIERYIKYSQALLEIKTSELRTRNCLINAR